MVLAVCKTLGKDPDSGLALALIYRDPNISPATCQVALDALPTMAPWHLVLNDDCCLKLFELCDGKSLAHIARTDKRLHARVSDRNSTAASPGAQVWRQLCASHNLRQPGTRTRGQLPWSKVYALSICIECSAFGEVVINDPPNVLGFERGRFALCRRCMRSDTLWRVMNRPEIKGDGQKLAHLLFRIETVRRELGLRGEAGRRELAGVELRYNVLM